MIMSLLNIYSKTKWHLAIIFAALALVTTFPSAQDINPSVIKLENYQIPRVSTVPTIDGAIQRDEWQQATKVELKFETNPGENTEAKVKTTAYIMEDGETIYVAFDARDPNPEQIKAYFRDRDDIFQDDFVGIIVDTFNAERRGFEFFVNALGAQGDLTRDDTQNNEDSSWNAIWDSAGQVTDNGYIVEMAIPYRSLRFRAEPNEQTWGINFVRIHPRDSRVNISDAPFDRNRDCSICQYRKITGFKNLQSSNQFELTPTLTLSQSKQRAPLTTNEWTETDDQEAGLDIRWAISEDWIANATINPDFSQIEADAQQISVNRTDALFLREARPFFLEGRDYFNSQNNLIHTRNIVDPAYGAKLTGKNNGTTHAFLFADDEQTSFLLPSSLGSDLVRLDSLDSQVFAARVQTEFDQQNNIGVTLTHRSGGDYENQVAAVDTRYYFSESDSLQVQWMTSNTDNPSSIIDPNEGIEQHQSDNALTMSLRRNTRDYSLNAHYQRFGEDFRADLGFISRVDFEKSVLGGSYRWFGKEGSDWTRFSIWGDWDETTRLSDGQKLEEEVEMHFSIAGPMQFHTNFGGGTRTRYFEEDVNNFDPNEPPRSGNFDEDFFMIWTEFRPFKNLWFGNFMRFGDQLDFSNFTVGDLTLFEPHITWQVNQHLEASYDGVLYKLDVPANPTTGFIGEKYDVSIANFRLAYQFDLKSRLRLTGQYNDVTLEQDGYKNKELGWQLLYSYKLNPQSLVFIGYSSNGFEQDPLDQITDTNRTFFAKFSYVWQS